MVHLISNTVTTPHKTRVIIWDQDGTITDSRNPDEMGAAQILPNIARIMSIPDRINIICSGGKTLESESNNYVPDVIIKKYDELMNQLPISFSVFSPAKGGTQCYVMQKDAGGKHLITKAHEDPQYSTFVGRFKKPDSGMFYVIEDILKQQFNLEMTHTNTIMIGDSWQDEIAATQAGIPFIQAKRIHELPLNVADIFPKD